MGEPKCVNSSIEFLCFDFSSSVSRLNVRDYHKFTPMIVPQIDGIGNRAPTIRNEISQSIVDDGYESIDKNNFES